MNLMSPQELVRKNSTETKETRDLRVSDKTRDGRFKELLRTLPVDENLREKDLFALIEEEEGEELMEGGAVIAPFSSSLMPEEKKDKADASTCVSMPIHTPSPFLSAALSNLSSPSSIPSSLSPEVQALFEKMASTMIVMQSSGEAETTLFLDSPQFASSLFYGTKITIREFSTAPKAFNIEIVSSPLAIHAIDPCKNDLLSAFQHGHFNFSIHRFDTFLQTEERPVLHRKEKSGEDDQERKGEGQ